MKQVVNLKLVCDGLIKTSIGLLSRITATNAIVFEVRELVVKCIVSLRGNRDLNKVFLTGFANNKTPADKH